MKFLINKLQIRFIHILVFIGILIVDLVVYIFLGLLLMNYEDNYDSSKGEFWSWASMNSTDRIIFIGYTSWNVLNWIGILYFVRKIIRKLKIKNEV